MLWNFWEHYIVDTFSYSELSHMRRDPLISITWTLGSLCATVCKPLLWSIFGLQLSLHFSNKHIFHSGINLCCKTPFRPVWIKIVNYKTACHLLSLWNVFFLWCLILDQNSTSLACVGHVVPEPSTVSKTGGGGGSVISELCNLLTTVDMATYCCHSNLPPASYN